MGLPGLGISTEAEKVVCSGNCSGSQTEGLHGLPSQAKEVPNIGA